MIRQQSLISYEITLSMESELAVLVVAASKINFEEFLCFYLVACFLINC